MFSFPPTLSRFFHLLTQSHVLSLKRNENKTPIKQNKMPKMKPPPPSIPSTHRLEVCFVLANYWVWDLLWSVG